MVKPNCVIYPLPYITKDILSVFQPKIGKLEEQTETSISYNYDEQYFDITGNTQEGCDVASDIIIDSLIPILNECIDIRYMEGTFEDVSILEDIMPSPLVNNQDQDQKNDKGFKLIGQPLGDVDDLDQEDKKGVEEEPDEAAFVIKEFQISSLIQDVDDFMIGPMQFNMQLADYIVIIPKMTNTDCVLQGRCIRITGKEECVNDAFNRFSVIQTVYIALSKVSVTPCIHYPESSGHYGLYFCDLSLYRHNSFVQVQVNPQQQMSTLYVILPVFPDPYTGEYARPKDLISKSSLNKLSPNSNQIQEQQQQQQKKQKKMEDLSRLNAAFAEITVVTPTSSPPPQPQEPPIIKTGGESSSSSSSSTGIETTTTTVTTTTNSIASTSTIATPKSTPRPISKSSKSRSKAHLNIKSINTSTHTTIPTNPSPTSSVATTTTLTNDSRTTPPPSPASVFEFFLPLPPENNIENFPVLSPSPTPRSTTPISGRKSKKMFKPTLSTDKPKTSRVLRILPQKSSPASPIPSLTLVDRVKAYNYNSIKTALESGLNSIRGFKGEIKLSAKIGKVLWTNVSSTVKGQIWEYQDIADIVVKELGATPKFTNITTVDDDIIECISSENVLKTAQPYNKTSIYEFHCSARNQPALPYKHTVVHMNQGVIDVRKVVLKEKAITEVDWISLDRKYDFQLSLSTKQLTRCDVKPYSTFIKRVSLCPITRLMTYENVPKFLNVDYILFKQTTRYKYTFPFVVEITRVEKVPCKPVGDTAKINAYTGAGDVWYDFEIRNTINDVAFDLNKELDLGKEAKWTAKEILGLGDSETDTITDYVKNMLTFIEKIERAINHLTLQH